MRAKPVLVRDGGAGIGPEIPVSLITAQAKLLAGFPYLRCIINLLQKSHCIALSSSTPMSSPSVASKKDREEAVEVDVDEVQLVIAPRSETGTRRT